MKESGWKRLIFIAVFGVWCYVFYTNFRNYTPDTFWTTSAGTLLQALLVILLSYLLTNRNADDRKKTDSLLSVINHILDSLGELDITVEKYLNAIAGNTEFDTDTVAYSYRKVLQIKRKLNNFLDILNYYPTTKEFNKCVAEIKEQLTIYFDLFESEYHIVQEKIPSRTREDFQKTHSLIYQKTVLLQTLAFFKKKKKK